MQALDVAVDQNISLLETVHAHTRDRQRLGVDGAQLRLCLRPRRRQRLGLRLLPQVGSITNALADGEIGDHGFRIPPHNLEEAGWARHEHVIGILVPGR